jgi:multidrug efflux system outer membrane protein
VFGDLKLNDLEKQLNAANPDLQAAVARFQLARAVARQDTSNELPTLGLGASATRTRTSATAPLANLVGNVPVTSNDFLATLNLNWEIDLFGRLRNTAAAARAQAQSNEADTAALALSLQAELASEYFRLLGDDTTIALLAGTIQVYDHAYELTRNRYQEGTAAAPLLDFGARSAVNQQARANYDEAVANYRKTTLIAYQEVEDKSRCSTSPRRRGDRGRGGVEGSGERGQPF